jgi:hypothetical protein
MPRRLEMQGLGAVLGAGFASGDGPIQLGLLAELDVLEPIITEADATDS